MGNEAVASKPPSRGRVLMADDSRLVRAMAGHYLRSAGYDFEEAEDGAEALRRLKGGDYDVVITDLHMPELDGFGVLAAVKDVAPSTEVIIFTGAHDMRSAIRALRLGAHDYLTKPATHADEVILPVQRAVEKRRLSETNSRLARELEALSRTDRLTGLGSHRSFGDALALETARARRHGYALSVAMLDIDHFTRVNETHGGRAGDEVLRSLARTLAGCLRAGDVLYRYGGDEFVALLPHTDLFAAVECAAQLVGAVSGTPSAIGSTQLCLTASSGVATLIASEADACSLMRRADAALSSAKSKGRNRVEPSDRRPTGDDSPHSISERCSS
jgi:two-component system cell cycle response regulator